ncbi:MAG: PA14 domain-containing protein [Verrucomicrobiota bacterium]
MKSLTRLALLIGVVWPVIGQADLLGEGSAHYAACVTCHGPDGRGVKVESLTMAPSLWESDIVKGDPSVLALIIFKGIKKESPQYVQQMLALENVLDDEKTAEVMNYVRQSFGGVKGSVNPKQVARWRKQYNKIPPLLTRGDIEGMLIKTRGVAYLVKDFAWKEYKGSWEKLPDFNTLKPVREGEGGKPLIDLGLAQSKDGLGMVFTSVLTLPTEDVYEFTTASDDGSDLWINGKQVVNNDGVHGVQAKSGKVKLAAGEHRMMVRFFERSGGEELMVSVKAKSLGGEISLSKKKMKKGGGRRAPRSIPLTPEFEGEAVLYRNFISGSNPRGIAVGYPGGLNLCWDADVMNLSMLWRGGFMDAGRHWSGRGSGSQAPSGSEVTEVGKGFPLMEVNSPETAWLNEAHKVAYKYAKDSAERNSEKTFIGRHPDYRFKGYSLDEKRFPTFKYRFKQLEVSDRFRPAGPAGHPFMERTLSFHGEAGPNTQFRIARDASDAGGAVTSNGLTISVKGGEFLLRGQEAFVEVKGGTTLKITYAWEHPPVSEETL